MVNDTSARRRNGIVALAAGAALLIGGGTYSLWSDSATIPGGSITAGNLALTAGALAAYDVSADRADSVAPVKNASSNSLTFAAGEVLKYNGADATTDGTDGDNGTMGINAPGDVLNGHPVTLSTWKIVPGDTAAVTLPYTVTLAGDNLVATLTLDASALEANLSNTDMVYSYAIFDDSGAQLGVISDIDPAATTVPIALFQAVNTGQGGVDDKYLDSTGASAVVPVVDGTVAITVVVFAHFTDTGATQDQANAQAVDTLGDLVLTLTQVRDLTDNFGNASQYPAPAQP